MPTPTKPDEDDFDLQPSIGNHHAAGKPAPFKDIKLSSNQARVNEPSDYENLDDTAEPLDADDDQLAAEQPPDESVPQGPPPSDKVDFENHPEFVWQREMLRTVRLVTVLVTLVIAIAAIIFFVGTGNGAKDSLKSVMENQQPAPESKP